MNFSSLKRLWSRFRLLIVLFFVSRIFYLILNPFTSDIKGYAVYAYFHSAFDNKEQNLYERYHDYYVEVAKKFPQDSDAYKSYMSRKSIEYPPVAIFFINIPGYIASKLDRSLSFQFMFVHFLCLSKENEPKEKTLFLRYFSP